MLRHSLSKQKKLFTIRNFSSTPTKMSAKAKVGFIGLGNMGGPMAANLIEKGHSLMVYDINPSSMETLKNVGATIAPNPADIAKSCDRIFTMLPNSQHVETCYKGDNGVFNTVKPGTLLVDSSTIAPNVSKELAALATQKGATFLDAPVSGGEGKRVNAAKGATLTYMVGGNKKEFEAAKTLLSCMGKNIMHCGDVGTGQAVKICNNMLLAISMIGTSETMQLGLSLGLDPKVLAAAINTSSGRCWSSDTYNPVPGVMDNAPSSHNYEGGFGVELMTKDMGLVQDAATRTHTPIPLGSLAHQIYRIMTTSGYAGKDFSSVFQFLQQHS